MNENNPKPRKIRQKHSPQFSTARMIIKKLLAENGFICSMSKRGDCYHNASMESWNHNFKVEAIHGEKLLTRAAAKSHVFDYINMYYNRKRLHSRLGYQSPVYFEAQMVA